MSIRKLAATLALLPALHAAVAGAQNLYVVAGSGDPLINTGFGTAATTNHIHLPSSAVSDGLGNLYIAASGGIRKVTLGTGILTNYAGGGLSGTVVEGETAVGAWLNDPGEIALDAAGNLYIADPQTDRVRMVVAATGQLFTVAGNGTESFSGDGGLATAASLMNPRGVAVDASGNIYIADTSNHRIRKVDAGTGFISTVAGNGTFGYSGDNGPATSASLEAPSGMAVDGAGNLFVADGTHRIRRVDAITGIITTVAGNGTGGFAGDGGPATGAQLAVPRDVAVDSAGNLYIADMFNFRIRRVNAGTGTIVTVAGNGDNLFNGDGLPALLSAINTPAGVTVDGTGAVYIVDTGNYRIRTFTPAPGPSPQAISFSAFAVRTYLVGEVLPLSATASSGLAVTFSSLTLAVCTVSGTSLALAASGTCTVAADQAGDATFLPAPRVTQGLTVTPVPVLTPQTIAFPAFAVRVYLAGEVLTLSATASSGLPVSFTSLTPAVCAVSGASLTLAANGACSVAADQAGNGTYGAAPRVTRSLPVGAPSTGPAQFTFIDRNGVPPGRPVTSNAISVVGIGSPMTITVSGGAYSLGCTGSFTSTPGTVVDGNTVCVRHTATIYTGMPTDTVLTIGSTADTFTSVTTLTQAAGIITGYYEAILRRPPEPAGLAAWENHAGRMYLLGADVNETWRAMALSFFASPEYASFNRTDAQYVTDLYGTFFSRTPEPEGLAHWTGLIASGLPRQVVLTSFMFSPEFTSYMQSLFGVTSSRPEMAIVVDFYRGFLARLPDTDGFNFWVARFRVAQCTSAAAVVAEADAISRAFLESPEYLARARTNVAFVSDLYDGAMRRGADLAGVQYWAGQLTSGARTRDQLRLIFLSSEEFQGRVSAAVARGCS